MDSLSHKMWRTINSHFCNQIKIHLIHKEDIEYMPKKSMMSDKKAKHTQIRKETELHIMYLTYCRKALTLNKQ